jgi:hypothetical protein
VVTLQHQLFPPFWLTLKEEYWLTVFGNRVLKRIFGPKRDEVKGGWRKLHNLELRDLYSSPRIIRMMKSKRMRSAGQKPEGKRPLGRQ